MKELYGEIFEQVQQISVVDTHEHLPYCDGVRDRNTDVLKEYLQHYMSSDIISAGMNKNEMEKVLDSNIPILERWAMVEPYWEVCRYTGYGRALDISVRKIYGIDGIRKDTIEALNDAFMKSLNPGHFHYVLKDICNIRVGLLDGFLGRFECDKELFRRVWRPENYIMPDGAEFINWLEREYSIEICTLDDWLEAFDRELEDALANGIAALKCGLAYSRSLHFKKVDYKTAYSIFNKSLETLKKNETLTFPVEVQDFIMHYILRKADGKNLTFQFHTGLQALDDFLDAVPYNKISAFGGDYLLVDGVCGHLHMARENVSRVLARKVSCGVFSLEKAIDIAQALFHDNPMRIFMLD